jgi:hypothetical protein
VLALLTFAYIYLAHQTGANSIPIRIYWKVCLKEDDMADCWLVESLSVGEFATLRMDEWIEEITDSGVKEVTFVGLTKPSAILSKSSSNFPMPFFNPNIDMQELTVGGVTNQVVRKTFTGRNDATFKFVGKGCKRQFFRIVGENIKVFGYILYAFYLNTIKSNNQLLISW